MSGQTVLQFLVSLRPAIPFSAENPCKVATNGELKRWIKDGSVRINDERWDPNEEAPPLRWSIVFFPNSPKRRTTIL